MTTLTPAHLKPLVEKIRQSLDAGTLTGEQVFDLAHALDQVRLEHVVRTRTNENGAAGTTQRPLPLP